MSVLRSYAQYSFKQTKLIESLLCEIQAATNKEEFVWKFSLVQKIIKEVNERGNKEIPGQTFGTN
jgi:hypothetical protein